MALYKGFSTANWLKTKSFALTDVDLVKTDLLNNIYTKTGERLMRPSFGTRVPVMAFEPGDQTSIDVIESDLRSVFNNDPRVTLVSLNTSLLPANNAIISIANLLYIEFKTTDLLEILVSTL